MSLFFNYFQSKSVVNLLIALIPASVVAGSLIINLNILFIIILGFFIILKENFKLELNIENKLLSIFFLTIIVSTFINNNYSFDLLFAKSLFLLRFLFLYLIFETLFRNKYLNLDFFFKLSLFFGSLISIDITSNYFLGISLSGFTKNANYNSLFGTERIAGGYLQFIFPFMVISIIKIFERKNIQLIFIFVITNLVLIASLISLNRMPLIMSIFFIILLIIFYKKLRLVFFISLITFSFFSSIIYKNDKIIENRLSSFYGHVSSVTKNENNNILKSDFFSKGYSSNHGKMFLNSFNLFKEKIWYGGGLKSFRINCPNFAINKICSTHPHNQVLEILNDTGLIGFILIFTFIILIIKNYLIQGLKRNQKLDKDFYIILLAGFLMIIWPIKSTGSIFSTSYGSLAWIWIAIISYIKSTEEIKKR